MGGLILTAIGIPQIITNIIRGSKATKDLSLASYLIWLGAAAFLTATSLIGHSSPLWIISNIAGVVESAILAAQVNISSPQPGNWKKTFLAAGAALIPAAALTLAGLFFWPAASAGLGGTAFAIAVALLYALNGPQIAMNYSLWQNHKRIPEGANPLMPGLVALGSLISLLAAASLGDVLWAVNSLIAIATSSIVLSQIFFPAAANGALSPVVRLYAKIKGIFTGLSDEAVRASVKSLASYKGGVWSATEYDVYRYGAYESLKARGASARQLALFETLCDGAPVIGGRFNSWSGD